MATRKRGKRQRERDLEIIADLYVQGYSQAKIAEQIGVSREQIKYDIKEIREKWVESQIDNFEAYKAEEIRKINALEREAWEGLRRSIAERKRTRIEDRDSEDKGKTKIRSVTVEERDGDPRFMQIIATCIDRRCKIRGIDAPTKQELSGPEGGPIPVEGISVKDLSDDELEQLISIASKAARSPDDPGS